VESSLVLSGTLASVKAATAVDSAPSTNTKTPIKTIFVYPSFQFKNDSAISANPYIFCHANRMWLLT
jgi:hypothetical protein